MAIMLDLKEAKALTPEAISKLKGDYLRDLICHIDPENEGATGCIEDVSFDLMKKFTGILPSTNKELKDIRLTPAVRGILLLEAFASPELFVSMHMRKIVIALDMVDWEEHGAKKKSKVEMKTFPPELVKKSLRMWLQKGEGVKLHQLMVQLGTLLGQDKRGTWGKVKGCIDQSFALHEKEELFKMCNSITTFYKAKKPKKDE